MLRDLVELGGYDVIVTRNGDEAKAMLRRRQLPVLVVANLSLPRLDGFALLAELRRLSGPAGPPVVVVSSSKELSGAAWNLKERLGVTELLSADASETEAQDTPEPGAAGAKARRRRPGRGVRRRTRALGQRDGRPLPARCRAPVFGRARPGLGGHRRARMVSRAREPVAAREQPHVAAHVVASSGRCSRDTSPWSCPTCSSIRSLRARSFRRRERCEGTPACPFSLPAGT